ncbi:MAG TPA: hypothetical protein VF547_05120 [Allosphingosinicella sp.]|jgi:hypothetical protein
MSAAPYWTPYRKAAATAIVTWGGFIPIFFWLIMLVGGSVSTGIIPLVVFGLPVIIAGFLWDTIGACPACGKSPFALRDRIGPAAISTGLWWPERQCSKCGYDLTEGTDDV